MGYSTLYALLTGEGAAAPLFAPLALDAAVLVSISLAVLVRFEAAIVVVVDCGTGAGSGTTRRSNLSIATRPHVPRDEGIRRAIPVG